MNITKIGSLDNEIWEFLLPQPLYQALPIWKARTRDFLGRFYSCFIFGGRFCKTIILLSIVGYEMVIANLVLRELVIINFILI